MSNQTSYRKYEQEILPNYRNRLNQAESTEDVKKFFNYAVQELFAKIFSHSMQFDFEDISLDPNFSPPYKLSDRIMSNREFLAVHDQSDLKQILEKLAETAINRYKHLEKHPERTNSKIRN